MSHKSKSVDRVLSGVAAALLAFAVAPARAAETVQPLEEISAGDQVFVSGGVGEEERNKLFEDLRGVDLVVSFARRSDGSYLSGVSVTITRQGRKASATSFSAAGPFLLANLPAGRYSLSASLDGWSTVEREIEIDTAHRQRLYVTLEPEQAERQD